MRFLPWYNMYVLFLFTRYFSYLNNYILNLKFLKNIYLKK